ncbi:MAG: hypothetical protein AMJ81_12685 [Phycisphaerae bacterium SM23_33]|nr:MAG: hypothetical protein AMJ81_12685 [Phycisphaerae bacterium SM23_33]
MTIGAMAPSPDEAEQLLRRARRDGQALGRLYDRHYDGVYRYCVHRLFLREAAEDVTSEVFLQVARQIRTFAGATESDFRNWLYAVAGRQVAAYLRKAARRKALLEAAAYQGRLTASRTEDCQDELDWPSLYQAIAGLSEREQTVVTLRGFEELPYEQIAVVLNVKPAAARVVFSRALKKLKKRLLKSMGSARGDTSCLATKRNSRRPWRS